MSNARNPSFDGKAAVIDAVDIVALVSQSVKLKRVGRKMLGLCPFHQEKTPSFNVDPEKRYFMCFGCKASGNAIDFVMKRDRLEFKTPCSFLARESGIELPQFRGQGGAKQGEKQTLQDANAAAAGVYQQLFNAPAGQVARDYMLGRGFTPATLDAFRVGFAPDAWDTLAQSPAMKKFERDQLSLAGLLKTRERGPGHYDTFRNRVMFPIRDESGRTIALGGRVLPGSDNPAKYLNSPETPIFSKSKTAYGIDLARQRIIDSRTVVIVEGYTDVMMAHQFDCKNVVSVLGTALTEQHVNLLRRFADKIVLLFDADTAGEGASDRSIELFLSQPIDISVAALPEGLDPDELLLKEGKAGFEKIIAGAEDAMSFQWRGLLAKYRASGDSFTQKQQAVTQFLERLANARGSREVDPMRWGAALARASHLSGISMDDLKQRFKAMPAPRKTPRSGEDVTPIPSQPARRSNRQDVAEMWILGAILAQPQQWHEVQLTVAPGDFADPARRALAELVWDMMAHEGELNFHDLLGRVDEVGKTLAIEAFEAADASGERNKLCQAGVTFFAAQKEAQQATEDLAKLKENGNGDAADKLLLDLQAKNAARQCRAEGEYCAWSSCVLCKILKPTAPTAWE